MSKIQVPPIKCQGIKTKLVPFIQEYIDWEGEGKWIEPFLGSGVVGFNVNPKRAIFADSNPHIINFYQSINEKKITPSTVKRYLVDEGKKLTEGGKDYYYEVRTRFNKYHQPLDFLFLSRAGFNGVMRFNKKGGFNVPFNHKPERFSKAYVTKIVNQVRAIYKLCQLNDWQFVCQDFDKTLAEATEKDFIYCDPPYIGRHVDYFNSWDDNEEKRLHGCLSKTKAKFMLSTWHSNQHRDNPYISSLWSDFVIVNREHFYHVGAKETNRKPMLESIIMNYEIENGLPEVIEYQQLRLLEKSAEYAK
ncbi:MAG: Dam family site-specific DNA-(adenine-N6)-methyltransferase [Pseudomonadota bacterium]|nr:Dam family site-specific DNA-(adenine-N6)-methyltransferase [Pseudomonadota bacterium]